MLSAIRPAFTFVTQNPNPVYPAPASLPPQGKGLMATYTWQPDSYGVWAGDSDDLTIIPEARESADTATDASQEASAMRGSGEASAAQGSGEASAARESGGASATHTVQLPLPPQPHRARQTGARCRSAGSSSSVNAVSEPFADSMGSKGESSESQESLMQRHRSTPLQLLHMPAQVLGVGALRGEARHRRASLPALPASPPLGPGVRCRLQTVSSSHAAGAARPCRARRAGNTPRNGLVDVFRAAAAVIEQQEQQQQGSTPPRNTSSSRRAALRQSSLSRRGLVEQP